MGRRFCLDGGREGGEVSLPVVRPVFEVELLVGVDRRYGRENHPIAIGNTVHSEVGTSVEPIIDPTSFFFEKIAVGLFTKKSTTY